MTSPTALEALALRMTDLIALAEHWEQRGCEMAKVAASQERWHVNERQELAHAANCFAVAAALRSRASQGEQQ